MNKTKVPLIGIACGIRNNLPKYPDLYIESVKMAGGKAAFLSSMTNVPDQIEEYDGFIIPGGRDIDPSFYREKLSFAGNLEASERVYSDLSLLSWAIKAEKPIMGICYGMQLINVFFGGTLHQDISSQLSGGLNHSAGTHTIKIIPNPCLKPGEYEVNTSHHQSIKEPGLRIRTFALASDGTVEAFYVDQYCYLVGVQWHPERMFDSLSKEFFNGFIEACCACH